MDYNEQFAKKDKCRMTVYVRDTYRRTGRGKSDFEMHYNEKQCSRAVRVHVDSHGRGYCFQHAQQKGLV